MQKILIVEDDKGISHSLKLYLENSNFEVHLYYEGLGALEEIAKIKPDLLILDINLPGKNGIEIAKEIRINSSLPIVILTARGSELDRITGLEIGADDYIAKPFSPRELLARINTILRRIKVDHNSDGNTISYGNVFIDIDKKIVKLNNILISLTGNEFDILKKIVEENGKLVKRETLMTEAIGYDKYIYDRTIDTHIKNLRKKLGNKDLILTVRGEGYRLNK
ncbi:response regulator transcription factor [Candidatus Gracilibacteria bacterium 28_42_T64]|nr:response regulator transcription factor [Candidatus Gracilibacteria bacterium 28_42_T64]